MAYNTVTNYYDSNIADSYGANISAQIKRIEDAHKVIRSKAIEMGLKIPQGAKLTHNASGTTELLLADSHHILDTAAAINNMPINKHQSQTLTAGTSYTVPVGYNGVAYKITASSLSGQTSGTAAAADILAGKTAWVNGSQLTGTMSNLSGNQKSAEFGSYTSNNNSYLQVRVPATGKYTEGSFLQSDIKYFNPENIELPVTVSTTANGETLIDSSKKTFAAGYYSGPFNVHAVYEQGTNNRVINISNTVGTTLSAKEGSLTIPTGYDYLAPKAAYKIKDGSITAVTRSVNSETGVVTFGGGVTTAGWISSNVTKPATYTPTSAVYEINPNTGVATVTTAGWVTKDSTVGGLTPGSAILSGPTIASSATTIGGISIAANEYYVKLATTAGYIGTDSKAINIGRAKISTATSSATSGGTTITTKRWKVTTTKGYNPSAVTTELVVQDGTVNPSVTIDSSYNCSMKITKSGWVDAKTISLSINVADQAYVLGNDDLSISNKTTPEITVEAAPGSLMKSLTIDTSQLFNRLASI